MAFVRPGNFTQADSENDAWYCLLKLQFTDKHARQVYEKVMPVQYRKVVANQQFWANLVTPLDEAVLKGDKIITSRYQFACSEMGDHVQWKNKNGVVIIEDGPFARVNRKPTVAASLKRMNTFILKEKTGSTMSFKHRSLESGGRYQSDSAGIPGLSGNVQYYFGPNNFIDVRYGFLSDSSKKAPALEAGISFLVPSSLTEFRWIGNGPYAGYPGKSALNEFGFYHLNRDDLYFEGNRQNVDLAVFSDANGNGFALVGDHGNIAVERTDKGLLVSHNALVSGRFNKGNLPEELRSFDNSDIWGGRFTIISLCSPWPPILEKLLGPAQQTAIPYKPFYRSYDQ